MVSVGRGHGCQNNQLVASGGLGNPLQNLGDISTVFQLHCAVLAGFWRHRPFHEAAAGNFEYNETIPGCPV